MEKKKITPRKIASADDQEKALKLLLQNNEQIKESTPSVLDTSGKEKSVKKEKSVPKKQAIVKPVKAKRPATIVRRKAQDIIKPVVEVQRITIDLPVDLYDQLRDETERKGATLKWQIVNLLREHFKKA